MSSVRLAGWPLCDLEDIWLERERARAANCRLVFFFASSFLNDLFQFWSKLSRPHLRPILIFIVKSSYWVLQITTTRLPFWLIDLRDSWDVNQCFKCKPSAVCWLPAFSMNNRYLIDESGMQRKGVFQCSSPLFFVLCDSLAFSFHLSRSRAVPVANTHLFLFDSIGVRTFLPRPYEGSSSQFELGNCLDIDVFHASGPLLLQFHYSFERHLLYCIFYQYLMFPFNRVSHKSYVKNSVSYI